MEKNFTMDNTEGFTQKQLDEMNAEFEALMSDVSEDDPNYDSIFKNNSKYVCDKQY